MTDILDFNFSNGQSFNNKNKYKSDSQRKTIQSKLFFPNSFYLQSIFSTSQEKCYKFIELDDIHTIIIRIQQSLQRMNIVFKLLRSDQILRVKSNYLKSFFSGEFLKNQNCLFHRKINPLNGEISLQFSLYNQKNHQYQILYLIEFIRNQPQDVIDFWMNVLNIINGNYYPEDKNDCKEKLNDIKILSSLIRKQKQYETVYTVKPILQTYCLPLPNDLNQLKKYLISQSQELEMTKFNWEYRKNLEQIQRDKKILQQSNIRNIQNYQHLQFLNPINQKQKFQFFNKTNQTRKDQIVKVQDKFLGKLFLNHSGYENQSVDIMIQKLAFIDRTHQFNFLNYYFIAKQERRKVLMKMALKKVTLKQYIVKNSMTMSFESKLKIFLQIFFAVQVLWEKFDIFSGILSLENIDITKTFIIKLENIQKWQLLKVQKNQLSEYDRYLAKTQTIIRLQNLFHCLFYKKQLYYLKPSLKIRKNSLIQYDRQTSFLKNNIDEKIMQTSLYGLPQILTSISYFFKQFQKYETLKTSYKSEEEKWNHLQDIKHNFKNGSFDLILGILFKSLQVITALS